MARVTYTENQLKNRVKKSPKKRKIKKPENPDYSLFPVLVERQFGIKMVREHKFHPERKWRFDYAVLSHMIAVEVEGGIYSGGRHVRGSGFKKDMEKYSEASVMGWTIIRVTPDELISTKTFELLYKAINLVKI